MQNRHLASQTGLSLLELSVTLAIGGVLVLLQMRQQTEALRLAQMDNESKWVAAVMSDIPIQIGSSNYAKLDNFTLGAIRSVPPAFLHPNVLGTTVDNGFGGQVTVAPLSLAGPNNAYALTYTNIPQQSCAQMVAFFSKAGDAIGKPIFGIVGKTGGDPSLDNIGVDLAEKNIVLKKTVAEQKVLKPSSTAGLAMDQVASFCKSEIVAGGQPRALTLIRY